MYIYLKNINNYLSPELVIFKSKLKTFKPELFNIEKCNIFSLGLICF